MSSDGDEDDEPEPKMTFYHRIQAVVAQVREQEEHEDLHRGRRVPTPTGTDNISSNLQAQSFIRSGYAVINSNEIASRDEVPNNDDAGGGDEFSQKTSTVEVSDGEKSRVSKVLTLSQTAERQILKQLEEAITGQQTTANYCCGGVIPTSTFIEHTGPRSAVFGDRTRPAVSPPVVIRWDDPTDDTLAQKIQFPLTVKSGSSVLASRIEACHQSSGLDRTQFSTNFDLHDYGILDAINQLLLPDYDGHILSDRKEHHGLIAESVKLNVDAGYYGKPGAKDSTFPKRYSFGSLVVCLPLIIKGPISSFVPRAHLTIRLERLGYYQYTVGSLHKDCHHEALPVLKGNQLTLNYDLYVTEQVGSILRPFPAADPKLSPLYEGVKKSIERPGFMKQGSTLGFHCKHIYGHSHKWANDLLPFALKGIDATLFSVFRALGLKVSVCPMLNEKYLPEWTHDSRREYEFDSSRLEDKICPLEADRNGEVLCDQWLAKHCAESGWVHMDWGKVVWLNRPSEPGEDGWELAVLNMKYMLPSDDDDVEEEEHQEKLALRWSHAVILVEIPNMMERAIVSYSNN